MAAGQLAQTVLPWVLAGVMPAVGLNLRVRDFRELAAKPGRVALGLGVQLVGLPLLAWEIVPALDLSPAAAAGVLGMERGAARAITVEAGVQNAGIAMMVAFSILHSPALGLVPLLYGLLMNLPAFAWVGACLWADQRRLAPARG